MISLIELQEKLIKNYGIRLYIGDSKEKVRRFQLITNKDYITYVMINKFLKMGYYIRHICFNTNVIDFKYLDEETKFDDKIKEHDEFINECKEFLKDIDKLTKKDFSCDIDTMKYLLRNKLIDFQDENVEVLEK